MRFKWLILIACAACISNSRTSSVKAATQRRRRHSIASLPAKANVAPEASNEGDWSAGFGLGPELAIMRRIYEDCQDKNDFIGCLKQKALHGLTRALEQDSIKIVDGLVLEKQNQTDKDSLIGLMTDARHFGTLSPVDRALFSKLDKLMRTHTLKIDMNSGDIGMARGHEHEHEHKKKKHKDGGHMKYVIAALLTAMGIAGPLGLKALAAIAGKALVISKVALTIAGIIALKKLFSHDHSEETSFQVHAGDHNRRNTYVIRPVSKTNAGMGVTAAGMNSSMDPYRYYYEYHQQ